MNRIHPSRYKVERQYGYDPITNISFNGREGVNPAPIRQSEVKPVWNRLHSDNNARYAGSRESGVGGVAKPRDLSGGYSNVEQPMQGRQESNRGGEGSRSSQHNVTIKPEFVPSLTIPSGGMVDGRLILQQNHHSGRGF